MNRSQQRSKWVLFALLASMIALALLSVAGAWVYGVNRMSDPTKSDLVGIRIDGSRVSVKFPTCPTDEVGAVEVHDGDSGEPLWKATGPETAAGRQGAVVLWRGVDFSEADSAPMPKALPPHLDVTSTYAGTDDGTGDLFDVSEVASAHVVPRASTGHPAV
ncbi:hypothetical protein ABTZ78_13070 [Streptomyces bauhiniae]|uniref:hypothetical protein n=1 Tax=Streptomyces bauhiniae TaxID=2340725 RepID=UPI00332253F1